MLELLLAARGEILSYEHLQHALQTPKGCLWVYASKIRAIIEPYGWRVTPDIDIGYRVTKAG